MAALKAHSGMRTLRCRCAWLRRSPWLRTIELNCGMLRHCSWEMAVEKRSTSSASDRSSRRSRCTCSGNTPSPEPHTCTCAHTHICGVVRYSDVAFLNPIAFLNPQFKQRNIITGTCNSALQPHTPLRKACMRPHTWFCLP